MFSFLSMKEVCEGLLFDGGGDDGGKILVILLSGGLFEGFSGGFVMAF